MIKKGEIWSLIRRWGWVCIIFSLNGWLVRTKNKEVLVITQLLISPSKVQPLWRPLLSRALTKISTPGFRSSWLSWNMQFQLVEAGHCSFLSSQFSALSFQFILSYMDLCFGIVFISWLGTFLCWFGVTQIRT